MNFRFTEPSDDPMLDSARAFAAALKVTPERWWAEVFVALKMSFFRQHARGLVCSTTHGLDYFDNVVAACEGRLQWDEKGEYGQNFRKMIQERPRGEQVSKRNC